MGNLDVGCQVTRTAQLTYTTIITPLRLASPGDSSWNAHQTHTFTSAQKSSPKFADHFAETRTLIVGLEKTTAHPLRAGTPQPHKTPLIPSS